MPENDLTPRAETETPAPDYAFWEIPGESVKVIYSLTLFHEIDFVVNEGYRKIPHGGIEVGGLLFGTILPKESVRIEAFRPIECEHASGPSLQFSERDLAELEKQIADSTSDHDLQKLKPIGWFLAHTRGPLDLAETEAKQFDSFFPDPLQLTVLVKPERFQPTRFGFLVRKINGEMPREATSSAVILPLPGRSHKSGQLIPSIPAPTPSSNARRAVQSAVPIRPETDDSEEEVEEPKPVRPIRREKKADASPMSIWKIPPDSEAATSEGALEEDAEAGYEQEWEPRTPAEREARRRLARDRVRVMEQAFQRESMPFRPAALPSLPANAALGYPGAVPGGLVPPGFVPNGYFPPGYVPPGYIAAPDSESRAHIFNPRSITALALAAVLGCLVGYIGYLQLPAPVIPLDVRSVNQTIVVSWPPEETRNSIYAAVRFNDGAPVPLSAEEKTGGQVTLAAANDFKVEVMARNWVRDSRGVVRYMHSANGNGQIVPSESIPPK